MRGIYVCYICEMPVPRTRHGIKTVVPCRCYWEEQGLDERIVLEINYKLLRNRAKLADIIVFDTIKKILWRNPPLQYGFLVNIYNSWVVDE